MASRQYLAWEDWYYDRQVSEAEFALEDAQARANLPRYRVIAAISPTDRTPFSGLMLEPADRWSRSLGNSASQRFSAATQISPDNVQSLQVAWTFEAEQVGNVQATPVFDGERLIALLPGDQIVALDPASGRQLWSHRAGNEAARRGFVLDAHSGDDSATLFFADGRDLVALDAATGEPYRPFGNGSVRLSGPSKVAPAICGDLVVSANTGARTTVEAFDKHTGERAWSVHLTPDELPEGTGGRPSRQEGGNPWGGFAVDQERCIAFVSTGNPGPVLVGVERPGPNPGTNSVIAVDLTEGRVLWRFQETAHDLWDLDLPASPVLASVTIDGRRSDVVATPTKAGNTLLLDRITGQPIFDWRLERAPVSRVPGERTAEYQPAPVLPEPFARQRFGLAELEGEPAERRNFLLAALENARFGFYVPPDPGYPLVFYGLHGGAEWPGAAVDPVSESFFVAANNVPSILRLIPEQVVSLDDNHPGRAVYLENCAACHGSELEGGIGPNILDAGRRFSREALTSIILNGQQAMPAVSLSDNERNAVAEYLGSGTSSATLLPRYRRAEYERFYDAERLPGTRPPWGTLTRIDLSTGRIAWQVPLGIDRQQEALGRSGTGTENFGGLLATASGLLFATGTKDRMLHAFSTASGERLASFDLPFNGSAPPMTFVFRGEQYVVVPATGGGTLRNYDPDVAVGNTLVAFKLRPEAPRRPQATR